jgi:uncharacterized protein (DUF697 family)
MAGKSKKKLRLTANGDFLFSPIFCLKVVQTSLFTRLGEKAEMPEEQGKDISQKMIKVGTVGRTAARRARSTRI